MKYLKSITLLVIILIVSGCSSIAPNYQSDFKTVNGLKNNNLHSMKSGEFTEKDKTVNDITIRGGEMSSPYDKSFGKYLKKALEEELKQASLWDKSSNFEVSGILLKNELDGSGMNIGTADISAKFVVKKNRKVIYSKTHTIHHEWESAFAGMTAIPRAQNNYVTAIQKLLKAFFLDKELLVTLKK